MTERPLFFYSANKQIGNLGDVVINRELLRLARGHGMVRALAEGVSPAFLDAVELSCQERLSKARFLRELSFQVGACFLRKSRGNVGARGARVLLTPGGSNDKLRFVFSRDLREFARLFLLRAARIPVGHFGMSLPHSATRCRAAYETVLRPHGFKQIIGARDKRTLGILRCWGIDNCTLMPDLAFMMEPAGEMERRTIDEPFIVISLRRDWPSYRDREEYVLDSVIDWGIGKGIRQFHLSSQVDSDRERMEKEDRRLTGRIDIVRTHDTLPEKDLFNLYRNAELVVSNRLHVLIFAWIHGGVPLAMTSSHTNPKVTSIFSDEGLSELIFDMEDRLSSDDISRRLDRIRRSREEIVRSLTGRIDGKRMKIRRLFEKFAEQ